MVKRSPGFYLIVEPKKVYPPHIKGMCWECFTPLTGNQRRYCDSGCQHVYWDNTHTREYITWAEVRRKVFERDHYTCMGCHKKFRDHELEAHHIIPLYKGGDEFDMENLITLCAGSGGCHNKTKKRKAKVKTAPTLAAADVRGFFCGHKQKTLEAC